MYLLMSIALPPSMPMPLAGSPLAQKLATPAPIQPDAAQAQQANKTPPAQQPQEARRTEDRREPNRADEHVPSAERAPVQLQPVEHALRAQVNSGNLFKATELMRGWLPKFDATGRPQARPSKTEKQGDPKAKAEVCDAFGAGTVEPLSTFQPKGAVEAYGQQPQSKGELPQNGAHDTSKDLPVFSAQTQSDLKLPLSSPLTLLTAFRNGCVATPAQVRREAQTAQTSSQQTPNAKAKVAATEVKQAAVIAAKTAPVVAAPGAPVTGAPAGAVKPQGLVNNPAVMLTVFRNGGLFSPTAYASPSGTKSLKSSASAGSVKAKDSKRARSTDEEEELPVLTGAAMARSFGAVIRY
jgi:hypothetical protein